MANGGINFMNQKHTKYSNDIIEKVTGTSNQNSIIDNEHYIYSSTNNNDYYESQKLSDIYESMYRTAGLVPDNNYKQVLDSLNEYAYNAASLKPIDVERSKINGNISVNDTEFNNFMSGTVLTDPEDMIRNRFNRFNRFGYLDPVNELVTGTREFLFFSKPDLHLLENSGQIYSRIRGVPFFREAYNHYRYSYYSLQQYFGGSNVFTNDSSVGPYGEKIYSQHPSWYNYNLSTFNIQSKYIQLLSNMVTSTFDLPDITASDVTNNQNLYQVNTSYREGSLTSDLQYDFSLEFKDTKYLDVYMLFKIYDEYCRCKYMLEIEPNRKEYIMNKIYPEALSIWKVIVDDTDRVIYWAKATGCTPMSVPRGSISNIEGNIKFTVNWKAQFIKDMDPINLLELNFLTADSLGIDVKDKPIASTVLKYSKVLGGYNPQSKTSASTWTGYPLIVTDSVGDSSIKTFSRTGEIANKTQKLYRLVWVET